MDPWYLVTFLQSEKKVNFFLRSIYRIKPFPTVTLTLYELLLELWDIIMKLRHRIRFRRFMQICRLFNPFSYSFIQLENLVDLSEFNTSILVSCIFNSFNLFLKSDDLFYKRENNIISSHHNHNSVVVIDVEATQTLLSVKK